MYYIYILRCIDETLYTGIASDVRRRFCEHCDGGKNGAKYTKSHKPRRVECVWNVNTRSQALRVEAYIKKHSKKWKLKLISSPEMLNDIFPKSEGDSDVSVENVDNIMNKS